MFAVLAKRETRVFHVEFFGDQGSHSWLTPNALFPFKGDIKDILQEKDSTVKNVRNMIFTFL